VVASMLHIGPVEYGVVIVTVVAAFCLALVGRARHHYQRDRDELRKHIRRVGGPFDPSM
jgi:hypothetical protein